MQVRDPLDVLPLRQRVTATGEAARAFAGQLLLDQLSKPERYRIVRHDTGAQILAASERALVEAQCILRQAYGHAVEFGAAAVHTFVDARTGKLMVPVIFVRIDAPRAHARDLQQMLDDRGARVQAVSVARDRCVIRADIELMRALDLERAAGMLTRGSVQMLSWLVRYQPATQSHPLKKGIPS